MAIEDKLIDQMLANYRKPEDLIGPEGLVTELKKRLINRVLEPSSRSRFQRWSADEVGFFLVGNFNVFCAIEPS